LVDKWIPKEFVIVADKHWWGVCIRFFQNKTLLILPSSISHHIALFASWKVGPGPPLVSHGYRMLVEL